MEAPSGTTVVVVGDQADTAIRSVQGLRNVRTAHFPADADTEVRQWSARGDAPYLVHNWDPLTHVAAAWVEFFDDQATLEVLKLEIERAVSAAQHDVLTVPDYYIVLDPDALPTTWKHWWLGVLAGKSPSRVIPWADAGDSLAGVLRHLPTGRAWPATEAWLPGLVREVPDRTGLPGAA